MSPGLKQSYIATCWGEWVGGQAGRRQSILSADVSSWERVHISYAQLLLLCTHTHTSCSAHLVNLVCTHILLPNDSGKVCFQRLSTAAHDARVGGSRRDLAYLQGAEHWGGPGKGMPWCSAGKSAGTCTRTCARTHTHMTAAVLAPARQQCYQALARQAQRHGHGRSLSGDQRH